MCSTMCLYHSYDYTVWMTFLNKACSAFLCLLLPYRCQQKDTSLTPLTSDRYGCVPPARMIDLYYWPLIQTVVCTENRYTETERDKIFKWTENTQRTVVCHRCGPLSNVDRAQFWLMMKSLNYCPWLSSKMLLIQQSPMCSVRVGEDSVGNKYALCSHLLGTDLRLLLLSQLTSEVILSLKGKAVDVMEWKKLHFIMDISDLQL